MVDPSSARDHIKRLGTLLADLTMDRPAPRIHAEILQRLLESNDAPDPQLAGIYLDEKDFTSVWTAIRNGASLPATSWDTVVLPVVAFYSKPEALKANLQTAIHLWGTARTALSNVLNPPETSPIVPEYKVVAEETTLALPPPPRIHPEPVFENRPRRTGRRLLAATAAGSLAITLAAVAFVVLDQAGSDTGALPSPSLSASTDLVSPSGSASASEMPPVPTPAPSESGMLAPSAPRAAAVSYKTQTTVTLTWQSSINLGVGGVIYRVYRGMASAGTTSSETYTVTGLNAGTSYVFTIVAVDSAGTQSPPSNAVSVTTRLMPALKLGTIPASPIPFGGEFTLNGSSWPCSGPARVEIYAGGRLVAAPQSDSKGNFSHFFQPVVDASSAWIPVMDSLDKVFLTRSGNIFVVQLPMQAQCTPLDPLPYTITFS